MAENICRCTEASSKTLHRLYYLDTLLSMIEGALTDAELFFM